MFDCLSGRTAALVVTLLAQLFKQIVAIGNALPVNQQLLDSVTSTVKQGVIGSNSISNLALVQVTYNFPS